MKRRDLVALIASNIYAGDRARNQRPVSMLGCIQRAQELLRHTDTGEPLPIPEGEVIQHRATAAPTAD